MIQVIKWNPNGNTRQTVVQHNDTEVITLVLDTPKEKGERALIAITHQPGSAQVMRQYTFKNQAGKVIFTKNGKALSLPVVVGDSIVGSGLAGVVAYGVQAEATYVITCEPVNADGSKSITKLPADILVDVNNVG